MTDKTKRLEAQITWSTMYKGFPSIRDLDGEDIRHALKEAGFEHGDKIVITLESEEEEVDSE